MSISRLISGMSEVRARRTTRVASPMDVPSGVGILVGFGIGSVATRPIGPEVMW